MPNVFETTDAAANTSTTYTLSVGSIVQGNLTAGDHDFYRVSLNAGQQYTFSLVGTGVANIRNTILSLYRSDGTSLVTSDDNSLPGLNSQITFTPTVSGTYYLDASAFQGSPPDIGQYGLSVTTGARGNFDARMGAGIIDTDASWSQIAGTGVVVTWAARATAAATMTDAQGATLSGAAAFQQLTAEQIATVEEILGQYAAIAGVTFQRVNDGGGYSNNATMLFSRYSANDGAGAYANYPGSTAASSTDGDVRLNDQSVSTSALPQGSYSYGTIMHEIGHALGLSHPGKYNASPNVSLTYAANAQFTQDTNMYSVMSYFDEANTGASNYQIEPDTLMLFDVLALQNIYGANTSTRNTNTVYGTNSNAGSTYNFANNTTPAFCIWDGGGTDAIDASAWAGTQTIDLRQGQFSSVRGATNNISIAIGAIIENAIGGSGADTLIGNDGNNDLTGGAGADVLNGGDGTDYVRYDYSSAVNVDIGYNNATGGEAQGDTFVSIENVSASNGNDGVWGTDSANVIYGWGGNDWLDGRGGNDSLFGGNLADNLIGGAGADYLNGGSGFDYVRYDNATSGVQVDIGYSNATGGEAQGDTFADIEGISGTNYNDGLWGTDGGDGLYAWLGNDYIDGRGGNDELRGGRGADTLRGGLGSDAFHFDASDIVAGQVDVIQDFQESSSTGFDYIKLVGINYNQLTFYNQGSSAIIQISLSGGGSSYIDIQNFSIAQLSDQYYFA